MTYQGDYDENLNRKDSLLNFRIDESMTVEELLNAGVSANNIMGGVFGATSGTGGIEFGANGTISYIQSVNFVSGTTGFRLASDGTIEGASLTLTGGTIKYGKTSFTDSTNAGYFISALGAYFGSASDASKLKYTISDGTFDFVGTISARATATLASAIDSSGHFVDSVLNTAAKTVLSDFTFSPSDYSGAFKTGNITWNTTTGAVTGGTGFVINKLGIIGANAGVTTVSILTDGNATFAGTLSGASGTFGTITAGTITGVTLSGTINKSVGDILYQSADTSRTTTDTSYILKKAITVYQPGTYRIKFDISIDAIGSPQDTAEGKIYKNGSPVGTERSATNWETFSEDISGFASGDVIQLYIKKTNNGGASTNAACRNFRLYVSQYDTSIVTTD